MLSRGSSYDQVYQSFHWQIPRRYNIGLDLCDKWAQDVGRLALIYEDDEGRVVNYTFAQLSQLSNRLANGLRAQGVEAGDRVGILLPQSPEAALAHLAIYKLGAVAVPLFTLFGTDALKYRLSNSQAKGVITDGQNLTKIMEIWTDLGDLEIVLAAGGEKPEGILDLWPTIEEGAAELNPVITLADDPALIIYTSGTTGPPKGALHAHRVVLGHLPGVEFPHNFFPQPGDLFWTPADWAWIGGLIDALFPAWHHGVPVLARRARKFDPEEAFHLLAKHRIRNAFMPPTALKLMRQVKDPRSRYDYNLRSIGSGGETLGEELLDWGRAVMGLTINEFYGQTEANLIVANCAEIMAPKPGSMGRAVPGHAVEVLDDSGAPALPGETGEVAVRRPDPVIFLGYWLNPKATEEKFLGDWCLTGDLAAKDEEGYFWFKGRKDDLITSAGYRLGPAEIEDCLLKHPAVAMAAVVGSPDPIRTEVIKAFIVCQPEAAPGPALAEEIKAFVKSRLAAHEYPREIEFVTSLPLTATGKIKRQELKELEIKRKAGQIQGGMGNLLDGLE